MTENKLKAYLRSRQPSDAVRAFIDHAVSDNNLPDARSWEELEDYLNSHDAPADVIDSAEYVRKQYTNA